MQQQQVFDAMYGEFLAEARGTAAECGADVNAFVFRPDGGAVLCDIRGVPPEARVRHGVRKLVARDVSAMRPPEPKRHAARLLALRAIVVRKLLRRNAEAEMAAAIAADVGEGVVKVKRVPEEQQDMFDGFSKIRRVEH